jgi:hypothetical protein
MAFYPKHELIRKCIEWIKNNEVSYIKTGKSPWRLTGPGLLTKIYNEEKWEDVTLLPSHFFLPIHYLGLEYKGLEKVYAHQEWGSTGNTYENIDNLCLPSSFNVPSDKVSIEISNSIDLQKNLEDLRRMLWNVSLELIVNVNNVNDIESIKRILTNFQKTSRFVSLVYINSSKIEEICKEKFCGPFVNFYLSEYPKNYNPFDKLPHDNTLESAMEYCEKNNCGGVTYQYNRYEVRLYNKLIKDDKEKPCSWVYIISKRQH